METRGRSPDEARLLVGTGPERSRVLGELFQGHRERLMRMVNVRMDPRLRARVGASDVLQEAFVEVSRRVAEYLAQPDVPFFIWLRFITAQKLVALHRFHLGAKKRDARRQVAFARRDFPAATSIALVDRLVAAGTTPTQAALRAEMRNQVEQALDRMRTGDREVLVLRHFEGLSNAEAATELGIGTSAASKRYVRALERLQAILEEVGLQTPGGEA